MWMRDDLPINSLAVVRANHRRNNVSVQCSSRDCERFASLQCYSLLLFLSTSVIFLHFACNSLRHCSSSDNNPTYADCMVICQKKCSDRV